MSFQDRWNKMTTDEQLAELERQGKELHETVQFAGPVGDWRADPSTGFGEDEPDQEPADPQAAWQAAVASGQTEMGFEEWQNAE